MIELKNQLFILITNSFENEWQEIMQHDRADLILSLHCAHNIHSFIPSITYGRIDLVFVGLSKNTLIWKGANTYPS
jgi:hypothetical protein